MSKETVGKRLKIARDQAGLTQEQAAELLGISVRAVQDHESDAHRPGNNTINGYVKIYSCEKDWLLGIKKGIDYGLGRDEKLPEVRTTEEKYGVDLSVQAGILLSNILSSGDQVMTQAIMSNLRAFNQAVNTQRKDKNRITKLEEECEDLKKRVAALEEELHPGDTHATASLKESAM